MPAQAGRDMLVKKNNVAIAGGRTTGFSVDGTAIDVSTQGDSGFKTYLAGVMTDRSISLTIEGVETDQVLRDAALANDPSARFMSDLTFEAPNGDELSGNWILSAYSETGAYQDAVTFSATITSNGAWTFAGAA